MAGFVEVLGEEYGREILRCLRCQRLFIASHHVKGRPRICPFCTWRAVFILSSSPSENTVNCTVCRVVIVDPVLACEECGYTVCWDCVRAEGRSIYCSDCWQTRSLRHSAPKKEGTGR
jgi:hypothetical protein